MQSAEPVDPWARVGQVGLGALLGLYIVVQVLERVLPYLRPQKQETKSKDKSLRFNAAVVRYVAQLSELSAKVSDLHEWHNVRGSSGMHVWWAPVEMLSKIVDAQQECKDELRRISRRLDDLSGGPGPPP
jgi:hypothetical protein